MVHHPVLSVKSDMLNKINCVASVLFATLTWPLTADVALSIVSKNDCILVPSSSVISTYISVASFCGVASFNLTLPVPGSDAAVEISYV